MLVMTVVRKDKGITQTGLSNLTGIAEPQISALENQHILPSVGWQRRIADALGWDREPAALFDEVSV
ncbi:MAG: helix-turn-helix transcriptional regulator [Eggerthellaceae bacterium]|nr:helix-turn-helix transcriptional regulator [Eggerthellaceae bacterium]